MPQEPQPQAGSGLPAPPAVLSERFPAAADGLIRYGEWLATAGIERGLLGPREVPRLWQRHLLNCAVIAEVFEPEARIVDIGSGAGLPGVAVALVRPDLRFELVESLQRRTEFLHEVVEDLGLGDRIRVVRGRAEDRPVVEKVGRADYVTARAVAPLDRLVRWSFPLLARGGRLAAMKGSSVEAELVEHAATLRRLGAETLGVTECGVGIVEPPARVLQLAKR